MKTCPKCNKKLPFDQFHKNSNRKDKLSFTCRDCDNKASNNRYWKYRDKYRKSQNSRSKPIQRKYHLKKSFNLTVKQYEELFEVQEGRCYICNGISSKWLSIDHCHRTGKIRGLLCKECNLAIGLLKDNPIFCNKAAEYLLK